MARIAVLALTVSLAFGSTPTLVRAQEVPIDTAAVLLRVAETLHNRGDFALSESILDLILQRYSTGSYDDRVRELLMSMRGPREERAGRTQLVAWNTLFGSWLGIAIPLAFDAHDPEVFGTGLLLMGPAGFLASSWYANNHRMTSAQAAAATFGSMWGTWQAVGWRNVLNIGDRSIAQCYDGFCNTYREGPHTAPYVAAVLGGVTGLVVAPYLAGRSNMEPGVLTTISHGAYWGSWFGLALGVIAESEDDALRTWVLLGGNAGLVGAAILGPQWNPNNGQVWMTTAGGIAGLVAGLGVDLLVQPDDEKLVIAIPAAGSAIGLFLGARGARNRSGSANVGTSGALFEVVDGKMAFGLPMPRPGVLVGLNPGGLPTRTTVAMVDLFSGSF